MATPTQETVDSVVIRFAGDSGDGMQLAGTQFTMSSALAGNDLSDLAGLSRLRYVHRPVRFTV